MSEPEGRANETVLLPHCRWCGTTGCDGGCRRDLDPPRFCPSCGRRLRVLVTPTRVEAICREHGPASD